MRFTILNIMQATIIVAVSCTLARSIARDVLSTYVLAMSSTGLGLGLWWCAAGSPASSPVQLRYFGLLIGVAAGVIAGITTDLGLWAIATFNPGLPPQDFRVSFGVIVGVLIGAFAGALIGGIVGWLRRSHR